MRSCRRCWKSTANLEKTWTEEEEKDARESKQERRTSWEIVSPQDGVVRTNCMDCPDLTNVVQSMFGRRVLY